MYNNRIVCDLDDTISITKNRDWENAKPVKAVINKLNHLYDLGWEIWIVTARGQLSCNGDSQAAELKYKNQIINWLFDHGVKYHKLSFQKFLATYYIDDKNLSIDEFTSLEVVNLENGWSGAKVQLMNGKVFKTHTDTPQAIKWYKIAKNFFNVPEIYSVIGDTICMEYIEPNSELELSKISGIIWKSKYIKVNSGKFESYIKKVYQHCVTNGKFWEIIPALESISVFCDSETSFCHGDLTIENILSRDGEHYLIDPIYDEAGYSSYLLDVSKLLHSYRKHNLTYKFYSLLEKFIGVPENVLEILEISQWVRVYKYAPDNMKGKIEETINHLFNEYIR